MALDAPTSMTARELAFGVKNNTILFDTESKVYDYTKAPGHKSALRQFRDPLNRQNILYPHGSLYTEYHGAGFHLAYPKSTIEIQSFHSASRQDLRKVQDKKNLHIAKNHKIFQRVSNRVQTDRDFATTKQLHYERLMWRIENPKGPVPDVLQIHATKVQDAKSKALTRDLAFNTNQYVKSKPKVDTGINFDRRKQKHA